MHAGFDTQQHPRVTMREPLVHHVYEVVRKKTPNVVYVGRPTKFGNPFVIGRDGNRAAVIAKFEEYLKESPELLKAVREELRGRDLSCWCAPKACHADVLLRYANGKT